MDKVKMTNLVKKKLLAWLGDGDFSNDLAELVWDDLHEIGINYPLSDEEDAKVNLVFDECFDELRKKIYAALEGTTKPSLTLKEAILKHFGPGAEFFSPEATALTEMDDTMMGMSSNSCCGSAILASVWRTANDTRSLDGSSRQVLWACVVREAKVICYG